MLELRCFAYQMQQKPPTKQLSLTMLLTVDKALILPPIQSSWAAFLFGLSQSTWKFPKMFIH